MVWSFGTLPNGLSPLLTFAPSFACVLHVLIERDSRPDTREARGHPNRLFSLLSRLLRHRKSKSLVLHKGFDTVF